MDRRNAAQRGVIAYKDVLDQEPGKYLLLVDINPMQLLIFQVDAVETAGEVVVGKRDSGETIVSFSKLYPWYAVDNNVVNLQAYEDVLRARVQDDKILGDLRKEIGPNEPETPMPGQFL